MSRDCLCSPPSKVIWLVPTARTGSGSCVHTWILLWPHSRSWDNSQSQEKKTCVAQQRAATLRKQGPVSVEQSRAFRLTSDFRFLLPFLQLRAKGHSSLASPPSKGSIQLRELLLLPKCHLLLLLLHQLTTIPLPCFHIFPW